MDTSYTDPYALCESLSDLLRHEQRSWAREFMKDLEIAKVAIENYLLQGLTRQWLLPLPDALHLIPPTRPPTT